MEKIFKFYHNVAQYLQLNYINFGIVLLFILIGFLAANFIKLKIRNQINRKSINPITATFISQIISFVLKTVVLFIALNLLGLSSFSNKILAGAGLLTFVIGFALKDIGENFLSGIILAFRSPFKIDDIIEVNQIIGFVKDINIRETQIKTPDGKDVFIPNSMILKNPLFNYTIDGFLRYEFLVGIAYENNPTDAIKIILETVNKVEGVLKGDKMPAIMISELSTSTISIKVMFWVDTFKTTKPTVHYNIRSNVINDVVAALIAKGFSLPASIVELKNYEPSSPFKLKVETKK